MVAHCTGSGGFEVDIVPSCVENPPCPLPPFEPTWLTNSSTLYQPGVLATYLNVTDAARWGWVSVPWCLGYN